MRVRDNAAPSLTRRGVLFVLIGLGVTVPARLIAATPPDPGASSPVTFEPGIYRGQLGNREIQVELALEPDAEDSIAGWYFVFGDGAKILLAGEFEGLHLSMEESRNGKDVSGTWTGELAKTVITGVWRDADETNELPFHLNRIASIRSSKS